MGRESYIKFLWSSTNSHGVHSPFVFAFISQCLYARKAGLTLKEHYTLKRTAIYKNIELLYRILSYFRFSKVMVFADEQAVISDVLRQTAEDDKMKIWFFSPLAPVPGGVDAVYISYKDMATTLTTFEDRLSNIHNNTVYIIDNLRLSPEMEEAWTSIKHHPKVTVTIDTYRMGIVFFRREQNKQHFTVRLSKSILLNAVLGLRNLYGLLH